jgi:uncharacterized coiled-coil protein SlyX
MLILDYIFDGLNIILLIVLFNYQRNRNKALEVQLSEQRQLINEATLVVTQQSSAIEGQRKVVDTALQYSSAFDPKKLEEVFRRELSVEHNKEIEELKLTLIKDKNNLSQPNDFTTLINELLSSINEIYIKTCLEMFVSPLLPYVVISLREKPKKQREEEIAKFETPLRDLLIKIVAHTEAEFPEYFSK